MNITLAVHGCTQDGLLYPPMVIRWILFVVVIGPIQVAMNQVDPQNMHYHYSLYNVESGSSGTIVHSARSDAPELLRAAFWAPSPAQGGSGGVLGQTFLRPSLERMVGSPYIFHVTCLDCSVVRLFSLCGARPRRHARSTI